MKTLKEALLERHSVRQYQDKKIESEKCELLRQKVEELNKEGNLHLQFAEDAGNTFNRLLNKFMGLASSPAVIACVGKESDDLDERVGYYGQKLVLYAQQLGLNTCWAGTYQPKNVPAEIGKGEKLVLVIAIGYGE
ncbi:MAG: nitroreductase, partial [Lachnospiraceae bacterium]|nr:nitroreductase [Lachnospiraceae bacterium]